MTDLKNGIIDIGGFEFSPKTTLEEAKKYFGEGIRVVKLNSDITKSKFNSPIYLSKDKYISSFILDGEGNIVSITIFTVISDSITDSEERAMFSLNSSKEWLKSLLIDEPTSECRQSILYSFNWGYISARCQDDRDYGVVGGYIKIEYKGK